MWAKFTRELRNATPYTTGPDVEGVGRALARGGFLDANLSQFVEKKTAVRRTYGPGKQAGVDRVRKRLGMTQNGRYVKTVHDYLVKRGCFDAYAAKLMLDYAPPPTLVFPVTPPWKAPVCQGLHETGGLPGNWALDLCAPPGAGIVAVEKGTITRLSGSPPSADWNDTGGVYGWSVRFVTARGYHYFVTHLGWRLPELAVGLTVMPGDLLGKVGDQDFRPDHVHYGVSSPLGPSDAKRHILATLDAPRVT